MDGILRYNETKIWTNSLLRQQNKNPNKEESTYNVGRKKGEERGRWEFAIVCY